MEGDKEIALFLKQIDAQLEPDTFVTKNFTTLELLALKHFVHNLVELDEGSSQNIDTPENRIFNYALGILKEKFYNG